MLTFPGYDPRMHVAQVTAQEMDVAQVTTLEMHVVQVMTQCILPRLRHVG